MSKNINYGFSSRWDAESQKIFYSVTKRIDFPVIVTLREYKSDGVLWSSVIDSIAENLEYWMMPVSKDIHDYSKDSQFTGIKFCIYRADTEEQIYEMPFMQNFLNIPSVLLSNRIPYGVNYREFYVDKKYEKWLAKPYGLTIDVGANIGLFTKYMLDMGYTRHSIMIECDKMALRDLYKHFRNNSNTTIIPKALHYSTTPIQFYHSPVNPVISSTLPPNELQYHNAGITDNTAYSVETITISELVERYNMIDLLKIDIEGAEYDVVLNTDDSTFTNIRSLMIECHFFKDVARQQYSNLIQKLNRLGYSVDEYKPDISFGSSDNIYAYKL